MTTTDEEMATVAAKVRRAVPGLAAREEQERKDALKALRELCNCPGCPTYNICAEQAGERFFCAEGGSTVCISSERGCLCPDCPVHAEMGLQHRSFCTRGSEAIQGYETSPR